MVDAPGHELASGGGVDRQYTESLGDCLRKEREKRGLSHAKLFETTRLQTKFLEALENEDWGRIPDPAFIRGFVLTYGRALGLSEKHVLELYAMSNAPGISEPPPPPESKRHWKGTIFFVIIIVIFCAAVAFYLLADFLSSDQAPLDPAQTGHRPPRPSASQTIADAPPATKGMIPSSPIPGRTEQEGSAITRPSSGPGQEVEPQGSPPEARESESPPRAPGPQEEARRLQDRGAPEKVLRAHVRERTWIRIVVDDEAAREYIFEAGSRPEWKARRSFDLVIGNAGGVDLDFGGKKWGPLGPAGKVVRLRLPGDDRGRSVQD